jgi:hypothetical protein
MAAVNHTNAGLVIVGLMDAMIGLKTVDAAFGRPPGFVSTTEGTVKYPPDGDCFDFGVAGRGAQVWKSDRDPLYVFARVLAPDDRPPRLALQVPLRGSLDLNPGTAPLGVQETDPDRVTRFREIQQSDWETLADIARAMVRTL